MLGGTMVLMCVECWEPYDNPKVNKGLYGVCKNCNEEAINATPDLLREEFAKTFENPPSGREIKKLIIAGLRELSRVKPLGYPERTVAPRLPRSKQIYLGLDGDRHDGHRKE